MTKSADAFRTISEASDEIGVPQHVLRFWETKFTFLKPMKRAGGRRLYRPQDVAVLRGVKRLLHDEGMTIRGVQKLYREQGIGRIAAGVVEPTAPVAASVAAEPPAALSMPHSVIGGGSTASQAAARPVRDTAELKAALAAVQAAKRRLDAALGH